MEETSEEGFSPILGEPRAIDKSVYYYTDYYGLLVWNTFRTTFLGSLLACLRPMRIPLSHASSLREFSYIQFADLFSRLMFLSYIALLCSNAVSQRALATSTINSQIVRYINNQRFFFFPNPGFYPFNRRLHIPRLTLYILISLDYPSLLLFNFFTLSDNVETIITRKPLLRNI